MTLKLYNKVWIRNPGDKCQDQGYCFCNYTCNKKLLHGIGSPPLPLQKKNWVKNSFFVEVLLIEFWNSLFYNFENTRKKRDAHIPAPTWVHYQEHRHLSYKGKGLNTDLSIKAIMQKKRKENNWVTHIPFLRHRDWVVFWWCHFDFFSINFDST